MFRSKSSGVGRAEPEAGDTHLWGALVIEHGLAWMRIQYVNEYCFKKTYKILKTWWLCRGYLGLPPGLWGVAQHFLGGKCVRGE